MTGFHATISAARGAATADNELARAQQVIERALPRASRAAVEAFLDSEFGGYAARDVLLRVPVATQIEERRARFIRHFAEVERRLAATK